MHSHRSDRIRLLTTPHPVRVWQDDPLPPHIRFQSFSINTPDTPGRPVEESVIYPQRSRDDKPSACIHITPHPVLYPSDPSEAHAMARVRREILQAIAACTSSTSLQQLCALMRDFKISLDAEFFSTACEKAVVLKDLSVVHDLFTSMREEEIRFETPFLQTLVEKSIDIRSPLIACKLVNEIAELTPEETFSRIIDLLAEEIEFSSKASTVLRDFFVSQKDHVANDKVPLIHEIAGKLDSSVFDGDFIQSLRNAMPLDEIFEKVLFTASLTCDERLLRALCAIDSAALAVTINKKFVDKLVALSAEAAEPSLSIRMLIILFKQSLLSTTHMIQMCELFAVVSDSNIFYARDCFTKMEAQYVTDSTDGDASEARQELFDYIIFTFLQHAQGEATSLSVQKSIIDVHLALSKTLARQRTDSIDSLLAPLRSLQKACGVMQWEILVSVEIDLLRFVLERISLNALQEAVVDGQGVQRGAWNDIPSIAREFDACAQKAMQELVTDTKKIDTNFAPSPSPKMLQGTVLVFDESAITSLIENAMLEPFEKFMILSTKSQAMHVVVPFGSLLQCVSKYHRASNDLDVAMRDKCAIVFAKLARWTKTTSWFHILSSEYILQLFIASAVLGTVVNDESPIAPHSVICAQIMRDIQKTHKRTVLIVHSSSEDAVPQLLGVKPVLQLPALLERGKGKA